MAGTGPGIRVRILAARHASLPPEPKVLSKFYTLWPAQGGKPIYGGERTCDGKNLPSIFQEKEARTVAKKAKKAKKKGK